MTNKLIQVTAWFAVLLVVGNIMTYQSVARESASCLLAPGLCGQCFDGCGGHGHGTIFDQWSGYHFPVYAPMYAFSYYQNPWNYGGFNGQTTVFSTTTINNYGPVLYNYQYYDPSSGWGYNKNAVYAGGEELSSRQVFGW